VRLIISTGHLDEASVGSALSPSARVLVRRTVPHFDVMSEIDLLICHGGAGTLMKALHFGVPVLVVPLGAEQRSNGARFVHARTGKMLLPARLETASIQRAVHALLDAGRGYARAAGAMGEKARLAGGARYAASLLEEACERRVTS
jgi:UDP:flavonoid glycosyltransferase YjiC (YdhE family)